jgi:peptidoglycan/LPS O-acetylase OafA/YrhL
MREHTDGQEVFEPKRARAIIPGLGTVGLTRHLCQEEVFLGSGALTLPDLQIHLPAKHIAPQRFERKYIGNLTGLRALAARWVLFHHFLDDLNFPVISRGYLGVDVFFVLSGFVLSIVYLPKLPENFNWLWYERFLSRRFAKIYPMHLLTFALIAFAIFAGRLYGYHFATTDVENTGWSALCSVLMIHALGSTQHLSWNGGSWSIGAEWFVYTLVFAPIGFFFRRFRLVWVVLITVLVWSMLLTVCGFFFAGNIGKITNYGALRILPEFVAGYLLYRLIYHRRSIRGDLFTAGGMLLVFGVSLAHLDFTALLLPAVMVLLTGLYFGGSVTNAIFSSSVMIKLGKASYSIYLMQGLVHIAFRIILGRFGIDLGSSFVASSVGAVCALLTGVLAFRCFEEPVRLRLLRLFNVQLNRPAP